MKLNLHVVFKLLENFKLIPNFLLLARAVNQTNPVAFGSRKPSNNQTTQMMKNVSNCFVFFYKYS